MKNIIIVLLLGIIGVTAVSAYTNPLAVSEFLDIHPHIGVTKIYDSNNGATCYIYNGPSRGEAGISCIK